MIWQSRRSLNCSPKSYSLSLFFDLHNFECYFAEYSYSAMHTSGDVKRCRSAAREYLQLASSYSWSSIGPSWSSHFCSFGIAFLRVVVARRCCSLSWVSCIVGVIFNRSMSCGVHCSVVVSFALFLTALEQQSVRS